MSALEALVIVYFLLISGSEKVKDSESSDMTLKESNNINRSLLVLGKSGI